MGNVRGTVDANVDGGTKRASQFGGGDQSDDRPPAVAVRPVPGVRPRPLRGHTSPGDGSIHLRRLRYELAVPTGLPHPRPTDRRPLLPGLLSRKAAAAASAPSHPTQRSRPPTPSRPGESAFGASSHPSASSPAAGDRRAVSPSTAVACHRPVPATQSWRRASPGRSRLARLTGRLSTLNASPTVPANARGTLTAGKTTGILTSTISHTSRTINRVRP